ncbi:MAG: FtsQ-type POTRA domain-containing protein [Ignavibacteria bacterium]|jgi:cell division septal protein FtsQ|nr:FtsQ-type POTRA domain-containing protein [Ignavibacteria bacterium]MCU7503150.1 FtsQ-type POTRA domain-containing protein [Ignavibacteria bacterium]MCU7518028.1 FtsQ-type POTRA domain-containing protein [Ignavibacteria bacterium]
MKAKSKLTGILIFTALLLGTVYLSVCSEKEEKNNIEKIEIIGNHFLSKQEYFNFARLNKISDYKFLSLPIIKSRLQKHPYVSKVEVKFKDANTVVVSLAERKFEAILLGESGQYLLTNDFIVIPVFPFTKNLDLPVIENALPEGKLRALAELKNEDTKAAFRIIEAAKMVGNDLYQNISDVDLRKGKEIVLMMRGRDFQVILGRGNEASKMVYFSKIWNKLSKVDQPVDSFINYVDLRYDKLIYLGTTNLATEEKGDKG